MKKYSFQPNYNTISTIDTGDTTKPVKNKVIFGTLNEVYMSLDNLYVTSYIYKENTWSCPPYAMCMMPIFQSGESTLVHKLNVDGMNIDYQATGIVPGSPLNQYSMDEKDSKFRIITTQWSPERQTNLFVLDENLKKYGSIE
jgi:inhibitor of cysteine peptidase